jgi:hypothetical protein
LIRLLILDQFADAHYIPPGIDLAGPYPLLGREYMPNPDEGKGKKVGIEQKMNMSFPVRCALSHTPFPKS